MISGFTIIKLNSVLPPSEEHNQSKVGDLVPTQSFDEIISIFRQTGAENNIQYRKCVVSKLQKKGFFKIKGRVNHIAQVPSFLLHHL